VSAKQVLTAVMVMPVAFYVGVQWGLVGLALSWVIAFPLVFAVAIRLFVPIVALRARDILGAMAPAMVACSGMYLVVTGVRAAFGHAMTDIALLTMLVLSGAAAYAGFTAIFNRAGVREIIKTLKG